MWPVVSIIAIILLGAVAILALVTHSTGQSQLPPTNNTNTNTNHTITITAMGYAKGQPGEAIMYIRVNGTGSSTQNAVANLSSTMVGVNSTLYNYINKNLSYVATSSYNVEEICNSTVYPIVTSGAAVIPYRYRCTSPAAFEAIEGLTITIPNETNTSAAVGALSAIPNVYIESIESQFSTAQVTALRPLALSNAMSNATTQAEATLGSGYNLSIVNITVNNYNFYPFPIYAAGSTVSGKPTEPIIYQGTRSLTESVTVIFSYYKK